MNTESAGTDVAVGGRGVGEPASGVAVGVKLLVGTGAVVLVGRGGGMPLVGVGGGTAVLVGCDPGVGEGVPRATRGVNASAGPACQPSSPTTTADTSTRQRFAERNAT